MATAIVGMLGTLSLTLCIRQVHHYSPLALLNLNLLHRNGVAARCADIRRCPNTTSLAILQARLETGAKVDNRAVRCETSVQRCT